ncbi:CxC2 domain-containing protein [Mycena chlorophos]|uniref:CxC2 domain-containing protein n=1 Tax=Mycena chlorophos TaxID=658473 RepID=A0A8H6TK76_MYCCL|nr:CxC2 domain-containing protein [Mycena chlorophos]
MFLTFEEFFLHAALDLRLGVEGSAQLLRSSNVSLYDLQFRLPYFSEEQWTALKSRLVRDATSADASMLLTDFEFALFRMAVKQLRGFHLIVPPEPFKQHFPTEVLDKILSNVTANKDLAACKMSVLAATGALGAGTIPTFSFEKAEDWFASAHCQYLLVNVRWCELLLSEQERTVSPAFCRLLCQLSGLRRVSITFVGSTSPVDTEYSLTRLVDCLALALNGASLQGLLVKNVTHTPVPLAPIARLLRMTVQLGFAGGKFGSNSTASAAAAPGIKHRSEILFKSARTYARWVASHVLSDPELHAQLNLQDLFELHIGASVNETWAMLSVASTSAPNLRILTFRIPPLDEPMRVWRRLTKLFLDELVRSDGLGGFTQCAFCVAEVGAAGCRFFRCKQCGEHICCENCIRAQHTRHPLHDISVWTGDFWTEASLYHHNVNSGGVAGLGAVYQLGHGGDICPCPGARRAMVIVDVNGVFNVDTQFCDCKNTNGTDAVEQLLRNKWYPATTVTPSTCATFNVLDLFRFIRALGDVNTQDFVRSLEGIRDPTHTNATPDRYREFGRMARQYDFLKRMKRAGRAYETDGMETTQPGGLAVLCWACPDADRNLPQGWERVKPKKRYLYRLNIAIDANFRLKNRLRPSTHDDPSLGSGLGYFVESSTYKEHLKKYVTEKDVSHCVAFQAMLQKDTRITKGLRVSGVAGCVCARHGLFPPRYANVDWILLCTLWAERLLEYGFAYDIICQWMINFFDRLEKIRRSDVDTSTLATDIDEADLNFWPSSLACWRASGGMPRASRLGVYAWDGKTDGEAMERVWATLNPGSWAMKEMGEGACQDVLEDKIDCMNFEKNIALGKTLARKLIVAISERRQQGIEFAELDKSVKRAKQEEWRTRMDQWYEDEDTDSPSIVASGEASGPSQRSIGKELRQAELDDARAGHVPFVEGNMTVTAFVQAVPKTQDPRLFEEQLLNCNVSKQNTGVAHVAAQENIILQLIYMPGVAALRQAECKVDEVKHSHSLTPPQPSQPETLRLYLPSDLSNEERCVVANALVVLRARLYAQMHLIWFRDQNSVGQRGRTRSATLMSRLGEAITRITAKYRAARASLVKLKGTEFAPEFKELQDSDINCRFESESDAAAVERLRSADGSRATRSEPNARRIAGAVSWIWRSNDAQELHDAVRVEWCKARARKQRWDEEVELVREEMKRVLRSLSWEQKQWQQRADCVREDVDGEVAAGLRAYALRQVAMRKRIAEGFYAEWGKSVAAAVRDAMREDGALYRSLIEGAFGRDAEAAPLDNEMGELERFVELERRLANVE